MSGEVALEAPAGADQLRRLAGLVEAAGGGCGLSVDEAARLAGEGGRTRSAGGGAAFVEAPLDVRLPFGEAAHVRSVALGDALHVCPEGVHRGPEGIHRGIEPGIGGAPVRIHASRGPHDEHGEPQTDRKAGADHRPDDADETGEVQGDRVHAGECTAPFDSDTD